ncbi:MAG: glycosyltransferase [Myxococcales bacterium]|nr:glycosyltransferase [Myxococcales bacterium]
MLSVVHVLSSLGMGGQEMLVLRLAAAQRAQGWDVRVVSLATAAPALADAFATAGVPVHVVAKQAGLDVALPVRLARLLRTLRPKIVHTHNPLPLIYAAWPARLAGARVIHTKHGKNPAVGANLIARRTAAAAVEAFVAVSEGTAAQARLARECATGKLTTIVNGIDVTRFVPDPAARMKWRAAWGPVDAAADVCVVISVGRLDENKHHAMLLAAVAALPAEVAARVRVMIIGEGPLHDALAAQALALGLADRVRLMGRRDDVAELLAAADLFALTSRSEGLPLAVAEAMACGLPIVGTDVGGMRDVVGDCGALVTSEDAPALTVELARLIAGDELRATLGALARARAVAQFSLATMATEYEALYRGALAR